MKTSTSNDVKSYLNHYALGVSYNTIKRHLSVLINEARNIGMNSNPMEGIKAKKTKAKLHKPYNDIRLILDEIKLFNDNLYLCCIMTYGCLVKTSSRNKGDLSGLTLVMTWAIFICLVIEINLVRTE